MNSCCVRHRGHRSEPGAGSGATGSIALPHDWQKRLSRAVRQKQKGHIQTRRDGSIVGKLPHESHAASDAARGDPHVSQ
ncbi:MAG: hypothetical protein AB1714_18140 [Acidobacteriota bacterium]